MFRLQIEPQRPSRPALGWGASPVHTCFLIDQCARNQNKTELGLSLCLSPLVVQKNSIPKMADESRGPNASMRSALPSRKRHRYRSFKQQVQEVRVGCPGSAQAPVDSACLRCMPYDDRAQRTFFVASSGAGQGSAMGRTRRSWGRSNGLTCPESMDPQCRTRHNTRASPASPACRTFADLTITRLPIYIDQHRNV